MTINPRAKAKLETSLPPDVRKVGKALLSAPDDPLHEIALKLIKPEMGPMWKALERRNDDRSDPIWVWGFLRSALWASQPRRYERASAGERKKMAEQLLKHAARLVQAIEASGVSHVQIVAVHDGIFRGIRAFYEDLGPTSQQHSEAAGDLRAKFADVVRFGTERLAEMLDEGEELPRKAGTNATAIRFARLLAQRNRYLYDEEVLPVIQAATNAVFGTTYGGEDNDLSEISRIVRKRHRKT